MAFRISCGACGASYNIPEDIYERRVAGRLVNIRCKQCRADIQVDGRKERKKSAARRPSESESDLDPGSNTDEDTPTPAPAVASSDAASDHEDGPSDSGQLSASKDASGVGWHRSSEPPEATEEDGEDDGPAAPSGLRASDSGLRDSEPPSSGPVDAFGEGEAPGGGSGSGMEEEEHRREAAPGAEADEEPVASAEPKEAVDEAADLWAVSYADDDDRELTEEELVKQLRQGAINRDTLVWHEGMDSWDSVKNVPALAKYLPRKPVPIEAEPEQPRKLQQAPLTATMLGVGPSGTARPGEAGEKSPAAVASATPAAAPATPPGSAGVLSAAGEQQPSLGRPGPATAAQPVVDPYSPWSSAPPSAGTAGTMDIDDLDIIPQIQRRAPVVWIIGGALLVVAGLLIAAVLSSGGVETPEEVSGSDEAVPSPVESAAPSATPVRPLAPASNSTSVDSSMPRRRIDLMAPPTPQRAQPEPKKPQRKKAGLKDVFAEQLDSRKKR